MKHIFMLLISILVCAMVPANAAVEDWRIGVRVSSQMNLYSYEGGYVGQTWWEYHDLGYGVEAGWAFKYSLTDNLSLYSEVNFSY